MSNNLKSKKKDGRGKSKGNAYERKTAKLLSTWMFSSPKILYKHEDSGARKIVYTGDITPKDADNFHWKIWPFVIEAKNGYKDHIPTLTNQTKLREWIIKLLTERTDTQKIPLLICQFHRQTAILLTNIVLNAYTDVSLAIKYIDNFEIFYVYKYNDLLKLNFYDVMPDWFQEVVFNKKPIIPEAQHDINKIIDDHTVTYSSTTKAPKKKKKSKEEQIGEIIDQLII